MARIPSIIASAAIAALLSASALAKPPAEDTTIVVTGVPMDRAEARALSQTHAKAVLQAPVAGQNARWEKPLCIAAAGVAPTTAVPVLERIEAVARTAGADVAGPGCTPNVFLNFVADADASFGAIEAKRADLLTHTYAADREKLRASGRPVRWFYSHLLEGASGRQTGREALALINQLGAVPLGVPVLSNENAGRIVTPARIAVMDVVVLVDVPRAAGVSLTALADHIAFAVLSRTRLDTELPHDGIMGLFQQPEDARLERMTELDAAFLKALYTVPVNRLATVHRSLLADEMVKLLSAPAR